MAKLGKQQKATPKATTAAPQPKAEDPTDKLARMVLEGFQKINDRMDNIEKEAASRGGPGRRPIDYETIEDGLGGLRKFETQYDRVVPVPLRKAILSAAEALQFVQENHADIWEELSTQYEQTYEALTDDSEQGNENEEEETQ